MTSFIPGAGLKRPLNMMENPVAPDIKQGPPRFRWSGKFWNVDAGRTMLETEHIPQFVEHAVLVQSRDYNSQHAYGKSSFRDAVNLEFRPPLITMEDNMPLSRIPRPIVVPRINPVGADDSGTNAYVVQNFRDSSTDSKLTDRVKSGDWRPTFFAPLEIPYNNTVLPDLELKLPAHSSSAGFTFPSMFDMPKPEITLDFQKLQPSQDSGYAIPINLDGSVGLENLEFDYNRPQVSVSAGHRAPIAEGGIGVTPVDYNFGYNRPQVSASAGHRAPIAEGGIGVTPINFDLDYNRPQVSATAGFASPYQAQGQTSTDILLRDKLQSELNTNPTYAYQTSNYEVQPTDNIVRDGNPRYSYEIYRNVPYQESNERSAQIPVQMKKYALSSYKGYNNKTVIPRSGVDQQPVSLRRG